MQGMSVDIQKGSRLQQYSASQNFLSDEGENVHSVVWKHDPNWLPQWK